MNEHNATICIEPETLRQIEASLAQADGSLPYFPTEFQAEFADGALARLAVVRRTARLTLCHGPALIGQVQAAEFAGGRLAGRYQFEAHGCSYAVEIVAAPTSA